LAASGRNMLAPVEGEICEGRVELQLDWRRPEFLFKVFIIFFCAFLDVDDAGRCGQHVDLSAELGGKRGKEVECGESHDAVSSAR